MLLPTICGVQLCCWTVLAICLNVLSVQMCYFTFLGCNEWLNQPLLLIYRLGTHFPFFPELWHQLLIFNHIAVLISFFDFILLTKKQLWGKLTAADEILLRQADLSPSTIQCSKFLKSSFLPIPKLSLNLIEASLSCLDPCDTNFMVVLRSNWDYVPNEVVSEFFNCSRYPANVACITIRFIPDSVCQIVFSLLTP